MLHHVRAGGSPGVTARVRAPSASATANAAQKASPAPVVSTGAWGTPVRPSQPGPGAQQTPGPAFSKGPLPVRRQVVGGRRTGPGRRAGFRTCAHLRRDRPERMQSRVDRTPADEQESAARFAAKASTWAGERRERARRSRSGFLPLDQDRRGHRRRGAQDCTASTPPPPQLEGAIPEGVLTDRGQERDPVRPAAPPLVDPLPPWSRKSDLTTSPALGRGAEGEPDAVAADDRDPWHALSLIPALKSCSGARSPSPP